MRLVSRELVSVEQVQSSSCMLLNGCAITYITTTSAGMSVGAGGEQLPFGVTNCANSCVRSLVYFEGADPVTGPGVCGTGSSCMLLSGCAITYTTTTSAGMSIGAGGAQLPFGVTNCANGCTRSLACVEAAGECGGAA